MNHDELIKQLTPLHGAGEARAIVRMVMEERFGLSQTDLLLGKGTTLSSRDRTEFEKIAFRLLKGEPVQHVLGYADFCGHRFRVTPDVLIPRPETEELVTYAIQALEPSNILDLCTGSGCIAISLALAMPDAHVTAVDISPAALAIARENAAALHASNVTFIQQDILDPEACAVRFCRTEVPSYSLLVANPPYVRASEASSMSPTVLDHEPSLALFVPDDDPLLFYRAIARIGLETLMPEGLVMVELNAALSDATRRLFVDAGYAEIEVVNDRFARPRFLCARRNPLSHIPRQ